MSKALGGLSLILLSLVSFSLAQVSGTPAAAPKTQYSQEASVVELFSHEEKFETDGTSLSERLPVYAYSPKQGCKPTES
jgi:hypothetical protein